MNEEQALFVLIDYRKSINHNGFEPGREEMGEAVDVAIQHLRNYLSKVYCGIPVITLDRGENYNSK